MKDVTENIGLVSPIKIVEDYIVSTGTKFFNQECLDEVEAFALWVVCNHIMPLELKNMK